MAVMLNSRYLEPFVGPHEMDALWHQVEAAHTALHEGSGMGNDYLGWLRLPEAYDREELAAVQEAARRIRGQSDLLVVIGIGGSYLGARAVIELLRSPLYNSLEKDTPDIYFAGNSISPSSLAEIVALCEGRDFSINVVSKSGTTTEPALAFRIFRSMLEKKYGKAGARERIYCTTDKERGTLKELADREGYRTFVIPDDVGGRYSVLTPVGLLPIAVAGIDITRLMEGAAAAAREYEGCSRGNLCYRYAAYRNILNRKGRAVELFVSYEPRFALMAEWLKQLFGESEGKDGKGLFPASVIFSTDLHSMGQFVQDGSRSLFETLITFDEPAEDLFIEPDSENFDGLNFLSGQNMSVVSRKAREGTVIAHVSGGVPNILLQLPRMDEYETGWLIYFFEKACAVSGYLLGVNPFDQPGVEQYKQNMFALLGKPGYEELRSRLEKELD